MSWQSPHMPKQLTRFKGYFGRSFDNADLRCGDVRSIGKRTTVSHRSSTSRWARRIHPVPHTFPAYGRTCTGYSQSTLAFMCRRLHYYTAEAWPSLGFGNTAAVRARLGELVGEGKDVWWRARADEEVVDNVHLCLERFGLPFLDRFATRDRILAQWDRRLDSVAASSPARIVVAIILATRGQRERARELLREQMLESRNPGHPEYVRRLAESLSLGSLDG